MLPKKNRLTREEVIGLKSKKTPLVQGRFFGLIFRSCEQGNKFGLITSTKIAKKSFQRNKIKRLFYRAIEKILKEQTGWFLFLAKRNILDASLTELEKEMENFKSKIL